jgi:hypothetical protein
MASRIPLVARPSLALALALAAACHSSSGSTASASTPCGDYFDAVSANLCGTGPNPPATETARERARFVQVCTGYASLPGSEITGQELDACATAIQAAGCAGSLLPAACDLVGSLPTGTPCNESFQCQGGVCFQAAVAGDAASSDSVCGQCVAVATLGQPCTGNCATGTVCDESLATPTCVAVTQVGSGAACDGVKTVCSAGLFCGASGTCAAFHTSGESCAQAVCAAPLVCASATQTCEAPGASGAACDNDSDCTAGLGCSSQTSTCGPVTWASAGQPCGDLTRCLVGACEGACPTVIADGQPCTLSDVSSTCDVFAKCAGGTCVFGDDDVCR